MLHIMKEYMLSPETHALDCRKTPLPFAADFSRWEAGRHWFPTMVNLPPCPCLPSPLFPCPYLYPHTTHMPCPCLPAPVQASPPSPPWDFTFAPRWAGGTFTHLHYTSPLPLLKLVDIPASFQPLTKYSWINPGLGGRKMTIIPQFIIWWWRWHLKQ